MNRYIKSHSLHSHWPKGRWINPFILKIADHAEIILRPDQDNAQEVRQKIVSTANRHKGVYLELCAGSGTHLLVLAEQNPDILIIGVELRFKRIVRTAEKARDLALKNIILLQADAEFIDRILPTDFLQRIYINFPDPWDSKLRWNDRFLLSEEYLSTLKTLLRTNGTFAFKTDHQQRFMQVAETLRKSLPDLQISEFSEDLHSSQYKMQNIFTEFERLFTSQKKPVFYLKAEKLCNINSLSSNL